MAKAKSSAKTKVPVTVTITYDLFELPTAQHKVGLAGLLLQIEHMKSRRPKRPVPRVVDLSPTSATLEFTAETVQSLMNSLYDAKLVKVKVKSKWPNTKPLDEDYIEETDENGKTKKIKVFVYEVCQPQGHFLRQHLPVMQEAKDWLKLWRDMLWAIPRGNPQSRQPFEQRAAQDDCKEGTNVWDDLLKVEKARSNNEFFTDQVAGSLWLGAQALNAEGVPFEGRAEQTLLLHFWPLASMVYVPQVVTPDGDNEFVGYVLAIPEVATLTEFVERFPAMLAGLGTEIRGFRPAESVIDLPAQGALSFLEHLARLATDKASASEIQSAVASVEFLHLVKVGNNIKSMAAGRVAPRPHLLERYLDIIGRAGQKPPFGNALFRRGLMRSLLDDLPWFVSFGELFAEWPHEFFVPTGSSTKLSWFWADARKKLLEIIQSMPTEHDPNNRPTIDDELAVTVNRFVRHYLDERLKQDLGYDFKQFREQKKTPLEASEARQKLAERLFLEFRSRRDQSFVSHFSGTFFRVAQYMGGELFELIAGELLNNTDKIKTLTLMALSANSWTPAQTKETAK